MIVVSCGSCSLVIQVMGDPKQIDYLVGKSSRYWPDKYVCPRCESQALAVEGECAPPELLAHPRTMFLEAEEFYAALNGFGVPSEREADYETVRDLLTSMRITGIKARPSGNPKRTLIEWLELEDGTRVYIASGGRGATVYRIKRKTSYVEQIDGKSSS